MGNEKSRLTSNDYTKNLLQAMSIIAKKQAKENTYNKTILATIVRCEDASIGKYKIKYQDGYWYAYSMTLDVTYPDGATVYIMVPNGDMSKDKIIFSSAEKTGDMYINPFSQRFYETSVNLVKEIGVNLCSYKSGSVVISDVNNFYTDLYDKFKQYEFLTIGCNVRTDLLLQQQEKGNYGLRVYLNFQNQSDKEDVKTVPYIFDTRYMEGTIYNFLTPIRQQKNDYSCNNKSFIGIDRIEGFIENFPNQKEDAQDDVFLTDIWVMGSREISASTVVSYLEVTSSDNFIFQKSSLDVDASLYTRRSNKKDADYRSTIKVPIIWAKRNTTINKRSEAYHEAVGEGWEVLNTAPTRKRKYTFRKQDALTREEEFVCAAVGDSQIRSSYFTLINQDAPYQVKIIDIESDAKANYFYLDFGKATLCATCLNNGYTDEEVTYHWISKDLYGNVKQEGTERTLIIHAKDIDQKKEYSCSIFKGETLIGSAYTTYYNSDELDTAGYSLTLDNKDETFTYNEDGLAPNSQFLQNPIELKTLTFHLYNQLGQEIYPHRIKWELPSENESLLKNIQVEGSVLSYDISDFYDVSKKNNQIQLMVQYGPVQLYARTNFSFLKRGNSSTINNRVYVKVMPNTEDEMDVWPTVYYDEDGVGTPNWTLPDGEVSWFKVKLWNKKQITSGFEVQWSLAGDEDIESSWFVLDDNGEIVGFQVSDDPEQIPNLIVRAKVFYNGVEYFGTIPVAAAKLQDQNVIIKNGCKYVIYNSNANKPTYVPNPFVIENYQYENLWVPQDCCFKFYGKDEEEQFIDFVDFNGLLSFEDTYDGLNVRSMIRGTDLYIPIHTYLNYYDSSILNIWDGNSIDLGTKEVEIENATEEQIFNNGGQVPVNIVQLGKVYSPQWGSGTKDENGNFTGIVYGKSQENGEQREGLLGYYKGQRTLFFDTKTGRSEFGKNGAGQLVIDPSNDVAQLFSGNYSEREEIQLNEDNEEEYLAKKAEIEAEGYEGTSYIDDQGKIIVNKGSGLLIDLTSPLIKFGSELFSVDSQGNLTATSGMIGGWSITDLDIRNSEEEYLPDGSANPNFVKLSPEELRLGYTLIKDNGAISGSGKDGYWYIDETGSAYFSNLTLENGKITTGSGDIMPIHNYIDTAVAEAVEDLDVSLLELKLSKDFMLINLDTEDFSNCYTDVQLKYNGTDVTSEASYSVVIGSGVQAAWNSSTHRLVVTGLNGTSSGSVTIEAMYKEISALKTFQVSTVRNGQGPTYVEIESTAGNIFKRGSLSTILICHVYQGNVQVTNQYHKFIWQKFYSDGVTKDTEWSWPQTENTVVISAMDINTKAIFKCQVLKS